MVRRIEWERRVKIGPLPGRSDGANFSPLFRVGGLGKVAFSFR